MKKIILIVILLFGLVCINNSFAADLTISTAQTFLSLDGSLSDADNLVNGVLTINGNLTIANGGSITCDDPMNNTSTGGCPITISASGNVTIQAGGSIHAENNSDGGSGGNITITAGGNITIQSNGINSSSRTTTAGSGNGGNITITASGSIDVQAGSIIAANSAGGGRAGDISITAYGTINADGLIASGPSTTVLATKLTEFVLQRGNTTQQGGKITIISNATTTPGITVSTAGVIVSQGEDPAADQVKLAACGITVNGLVASVAHKSNATNATPPAVILQSGQSILVNGQDLGGVGANQGRIRADYVIGEAYKAIKVDMFAKDNITVNGPPTGLIYAVTSDGGNATNQPSGTITAMSLAGGITASGKALQAASVKADGTINSGSIGGKINLDAKMDIDLSGGFIDARGASLGGGPQDGGDVIIRSYGGSIVSDTASVIDVRDGVTNLGTVTLTACNTIGFPPGNIYINSPGTPTKNTGVCSPAAPSLPNGVTLPNCELTLVTLSSFSATPSSKKVVIEWTTEAEIDNAGFNIYRAESRDGEYIQINDTLITGQGFATQGAVYEFVDTKVQNRKTYYYKLEDIDLNGTSTMHGPESATPRWIYGIFGK
jgi:hypothetical protein